MPDLRPPVLVPPSAGAPPIAPGAPPVDPDPPEPAPDRPGVVPLRPLGLGDVLDGAWATIRRHPRATLGVSSVLSLLQILLVTAGQIAIYAALPRVRVDPTTGEARVGAAALIGQLGAGAGTLVIGAVVGGVLTGMLTVVITEDVLGRRVELSAVWRRVRRRVGRLIGLSLIAGVVPTLALGLLVVPGVWLWGGWAVAVPVLIVEDRRVVASLRRSWRLVRGSFWRVWGVRALGVLVAEVVALLFGVPFLVLAQVTGNGPEPTASSAVPLGYLFITAVGAVLAATVATPIRAGVDALLYVDLRIRREGLDIALRLSRTDRTGPMSAPVPM